MPFYTLYLTYNYWFHLQRPLLWDHVGHDSDIAPARSSSAAFCSHLNSTNACLLRLHLLVHGCQLHILCHVSQPWRKWGLLVPEETSPEANSIKTALFSTRSIRSSHLALIYMKLRVKPNKPSDESGIMKFKGFSGKVLTCLILIGLSASDTFRHFWEILKVPDVLKSLWRA